MERLIKCSLNCCNSSDVSDITVFEYLDNCGQRYWTPYWAPWGKFLLTSLGFCFLSLIGQCSFPIPLSAACIEKSRGLRRRTLFEARMKGTNMTASARGNVLAMSPFTWCIIVRENMCFEDCIDSGDMKSPLGMNSSSFGRKFSEMPLYRDCRVVRTAPPTVPRFASSLLRCDMELILSRRCLG